MKSKYIKPLPQTRTYSDGTTDIIGGKKGPRTLQEQLALKRSQAHIIIDKFGGPMELSRILRQCSDDPKDHYAPSTIYRWMYPRDKQGTGGEIPLMALQTILRCARLAGVILKTEDIYPNIVEPPEIKE